jgi:hypothetical protein
VAVNPGTRFAEVTTFLWSPSSGFIVS